MRTATVGWAVVVISPSFEIVGGASGTVPGDQAVPRSELVAALLVALMAKGNFTVVSDCIYVVKGFDRLFSGTFDFNHPKLKNADLWKWVQGYRPPLLQKAPAHPTWRLSNGSTKSVTMPHAGGWRTCLPTKLQSRQPPKPSYLIGFAKTSTTRTSWSQMSKRDSLTSRHRS